MRTSFVPHPAQLKIHRALFPAMTGIIVMVIAGRRFGKTVLGVNEIVKRAIEIPGARIWYVAPTKEQAFGIAWRLMVKPRRDKETGQQAPPYLPAEYIKKLREDRHYIELTNGSLIEFKGIQDEVFLLGAGLEFVVLDEFYTMPWSVWYDTINPMLADNNGDALFIGTPPDPKVHSITREYIDMYEEMLIKNDRKNPKAFNFSSFDNPHISHKAIQKKIEDLKKKGRQKDAERLYYGKYSGESGKVFPKFDLLTHVIDPFKIPDHWTRLMGIDPHPQKPIDALWAARDSKGGYYFYREMEFVHEQEGRPLTNMESAYEILLAEAEFKEKMFARLMDPTYSKVEQKTSGQKSVFRQFREYGVNVTEGNRDRMTFFQAMTDMLVTEPEPTIHVFNSCPIFARQMSNLTWDSWASARARQERGAKDSWKKIDDDMVDCAKFIINHNSKPVNKTALKSFQSRLNQRWENRDFM